MQTQTRDITRIAAEAADERTAPIGLPRNASDQLRVEIFDRMAPLEAAWRALEQDDLSSLHQSYDWCAAWAENFERPLVIVRGSIGDETAFILPLEIIRSRGIRRAEFIGGHHNNINTGLFSPRFLASGRLAPLQANAIAAALRGKADVVILRNIPLEWRGRESPLASLTSIENQNHAFQMPFLGSFETSLKQVNAKRRRKKFKHQSRILDAKGGYEHVIADGEEQRALLDLFFRQKAIRFKEAGLPNAFKDARIKAALYAMLDRREPGSRDATLQMHALRLKGEHQGHIPAIAALSRKGDHVICQFASIDEALVAEASPGELLFWLMIERLHREGVALFDFGIGNQTYKRSWCPMETVQHDLFLPISGLGHLAAMTQRGITRTKTAIKSNRKLYSFIQRLRARQGGDTATADTGDGGGDGD
ncbi:MULTISPECIES: GNAT family N-acetyltransferase [unclassified Rhizobium]|jgi:CelD/BcsL family acetyltransferase involved in cellulose biosynthesis|uniref:GNAT family N-acetyltransferase n=1 Tax=unclassified Rhizobium TaxID=2613769 RepID=UPI00068F1AA7|nr:MULTISPECIES: GNAT family N-acetyltransferase [unclassified Rhizobium]MBN8950915.1 GNAT family N-acetyltransferase [Rhizobium tropici]OJY69318.1 MAG: cellulose biosynthesis protein CelD [Rhizobium sp. 60-20]RKD73786.1 CelD/BcsL family acetyltransferase involved in cellulose biosynthesis [Rhizobium sp. WW_1]